MNKQIRGYKQGGGIADLTDFQNPLLAENLSLNPSAPKIEMNPQIRPLPPLRPMAQPSPPYSPINALGNNASMMEEPSSPLEAPINDGMATDTSGIDAKTQILLDLLQPKDYDKQKEMYEKRFSSLIPPRQRLNFYDLASELGAAILSRPQDEGVFPGVGVGFGNFQKRMSQADAEERKERQGFAMKAVELAMTDEREAEKILKQYAMEALMAQTVTGEPKLVSLIYDEVDDNGQFTGKKLEGSFDVVTQGKLIRKIVSEQNGVDLSAVKDPLDESDLSKEAGKQWIKDQAAIRENAKTAGGTLDMVKEGKVLANKLGPENFGKAEAALLPLKQFVAGFLPEGIIDMGVIGPQEAMAQITIGFTLANVAQTKGAISNREMDLFKEASPYLGQSYVGFMLALDLQEKIARKKLLFSTEYQQTVNDLRRENPRITGAEMQNAMNNFSDRWVAEGKDLFLSDEDKARISEFTKQGKAAGIATDYGSYESRMNNALRTREKRAAKETQRFIDRSKPGTEAVIKKIIDDPDLSPEDKIKAIDAMNAIDQ